MTPQIIRTGIIDMQVCVPSEWTDEQIVEFATERIPSAGDGWKIRDEAALLAGCPSRSPCANGGGFVHVTLDTLRIGAAHQES